MHIVDSEDNLPLGVCFVCLNQWIYFAVFLSGAYMIITLPKEACRKTTVVGSLLWMQFIFINPNI
jgi:hypothetical protein